MSSFNDMSKHLLVLWPLLLLLLWVFVFLGFFFIFLGGGEGLLCSFKKKVVFVLFVFSLSFFDGKSVMSALCTYYYMCMFV